MGDLFFGILLIVFIILSALSFGLYLGKNKISHYYLKKLALRGDKNAKMAYPLQAGGLEFSLSLLLINVVSNSLIVVILAGRNSDLSAVIFSILIIFFIGQVLPAAYISNNFIKIAALVSPFFLKLVAALRPLMKPIAKFISSQDKALDNFQSKDELIERLNLSKQSNDSDFSVTEIKILKSVLSFEEKKVRDVMTPRRMVQLTKKDEVVGPVLMDELHKSGYSRFPVIADDKYFNFVGTLYMHDLVGVSEGRKVKEIMSPQVRYIHEEQSINYALRAFLKTRHHIFVVVNNFEEFVGVLTIEDVLEEIIGKEIVDEFDTHEDLRAVANSIAEKERKARERDTKTDKK